MRLKNIFRYLSTFGLDETLQKWFQKAGKTIEGKVVSLHFAKELAMEQWQKLNFGRLLTKRFATYLVTKSPYDNAVREAVNFCSSRNKFLRGGNFCYPVSILVTVMRLEHVEEDLTQWSHLKMIFDDEKKCDEISFGLKNMGKTIKIGHDGLAWLTNYEAGLFKTNSAMEACDRLGKVYRLGRRYLVLSIQSSVNLRRPTIYDGGMKPGFRPHRDYLGWGQALRTSNLIRLEGYPEAVIKEGKHQSSLLKCLAPSNSLLPEPNQITWANYLKRELIYMESTYPTEYKDLLNAWNI